MAKTKDGKYQTTTRFEDEQSYNNAIKLAKHEKRSLNNLIIYLLDERYNSAFKQS